MPGASTRCGQAGEPEEGAVGRPFDRPQPVAVLDSSEPILIHERVALRPGQHRWKVLHHPRVGVHRREGLAIGVTPLAEEETVGGDARDRGAGVSGHRGILAQPADR